MRKISTVWLTFRYQVLFMQLAGAEALRIAPDER